MKARHKISFLLAVSLSLSIVAKAQEKTDVPTFNKDIGKIMMTSCVSCHHKGGPGPFSLTNFEEVKNHASEIVSVTQSGYMPPWKLQPGWGEFANERRLSEREKAQIKNWVEANCPQGEGKPPDVPLFPKSGEWQLGKPDLVYKMSEPYTVPASGPDIYRCFVLPLNLKDDTYVKATEFHPGNNRVTHHCLLFLDNSGAARKLDAKDPEPGYLMYGDPGFVPSGGLGNWAVGHYDGDKLPAGVARLVKKNSDLVLQMHFHPTGKEEKVQAEIGLYLDKKKPEHILTKVSFVKFDINIPPGADKYEAWQEFTLPIDVYLLGMRPHAHNICNEVKAFALLPDKKIVRLMHLKDWEFNWQSDYRYKKPIMLPKGTRIKVETIYDNSKNNPHNPNNPPKRVYWGQNTKDEMFFYWFDLIAVNEKERPILVDYVNTNTRKFLYHAVW